jgi:hypothetical protein
MVDTAWTFTVIFTSIFAVLIVGAAIWVRSHFHR